MSSETWLEDYLIPEERFEAAYQSIGDDLKAIIKKSISKLFDFYLEDTLFHENLKKWRRGIVSCIKTFPCNWGLILFDESFNSSSQLIAAVIPAIMSGVKNLFVIRLNNKSNLKKYPDNLILVSLELSGCEFVCNILWEELDKFLKELIKESHNGFIIALGNKIFLRTCLAVISNYCINKFYPLISPQKAILYSEEVFNKDLIRIFNPDINIKVVKEISNINWGDISVVYAPREVIVSVSNQVSYAFGPGQEGFWFWSELFLDNLIVNKLSIWEE